jgi:predicted phosphoadenosine phosphosulfate sulfurtransferase
VVPAGDVGRGDQQCQQLLQHTATIEMKHLQQRAAVTFVDWEKLWIICWPIVKAGTSQDTACCWTNMPISMMVVISTYSKPWFWFAPDLP